MKRVLILAYYAPPLGMGGTQRVAKFCEYLPEYGWEPVLLTVKDIAYYARDEELSRSLARARVERTQSLDPQRLAALLSRGPIRAASASITKQSRWARLVTSLLMPDAKVGWLPFAVLRGVQLVSSLRIQAVLVTSPPHSAQLAGWLIARATGVPWIADFRDRWCAGEFQPGTTCVHRALDCALERWTVRRADGVVAVTEGLARHLSRQGRGKAVATIYNGLDFSEFAKVRRKIRGTGSFLQLTFVGAVTDVSWPRTLLEALARCPETLRRGIRLSFVGLDLTGRLQREIDGLGLNRHVELVGYVSHAEAVRALLRSDVLYLPVSERVHPSYVPGKLFEYLGSLKPVLATVPEGETATLLKRAGSTWLCGPRDVRCVVESLRALHSLWAKRALPNRDVAAVREFDRREQARVLADLLDRLSFPRR